uniref:Uncharacterized protein n=1 Tax=Anguilla anguilla TaxID=7936 RepID=A0A0E9VUF0_ANGAN
MYPFNKKKGSNWPINSFLRLVPNSLAYYFFTDVCIT